MKRSAIVIGAGIHGVSVAAELASRGIKTLLIDQHSNILQEASNGNHNRAHTGYHYARSQETVEECRSGYQYFLKNLKESLLHPGPAFYLIEKNSSLVTSDQFEIFCKNLSLPYKLQWPEDGIVKKDHLECSFMVNEPCFKIDYVRQYYKKLLENLKVIFLLDFKINNIKIEEENKFTLFNDRAEKITHESDIIVNATYAKTNNIQYMFGTNENKTTCKFQLAEVPVVESSIKIPQLTVIDGPFATIYPYAGHKNKFLYYDVIHSVNQETVGKECPEFKPPITKWDKMKLQGKKYFSFMDDLAYIKSNWGSRPIPVNISNDARNTRITKHDCLPCFYSIQEGKFISAPVIAEKIVKEILS